MASMEQSGVAAALRASHAGVGQRLLTCSGGGVWSLDYYNTALSSWEPFLEPWRMSVQLRKDFSQGGQLSAKLLSEARLELNLSHAFLTLMLSTANSWSADYAARTEGERVPFVPYVIKNDTGLPVTFFSEANGRRSDLQRLTNGESKVRERSKWILNFNVL